MLHHIDDKLHSTSAGLLTLGAVSMALGIVVLVNPATVQVLAGLLFFIIAYAAFFAGYRTHVIHCTLRDAFGMHKTTDASAESTTRTTKRRTVRRRK